MTEEVRPELLLDGSTPQAKTRRDETIDWTGYSSFQLSDGWKAFKLRKASKIKKIPLVIDEVLGEKYLGPKSAAQPPSDLDQGTPDGGEMRARDTKIRYSGVKHRYQVLSSNSRGDIYSGEMGSACPSASETDATKKAVHAVWSTNYDHVFMDILIEHANMGSLQSNFTTGIKNAIFAEFRRRTNKSFDIKQIRTKYYTLKRQYENFKRLIGHTGFDWDPKTNTVFAKNEVWDEYLKAHPRAKPFKRNGCPNYSKLCTIFGEKAATGRGAAGVHSVHPSSAPKIINLDKDDLPESPTPPPRRVENGDQSTQVNRSDARRQQKDSMVDSLVVRSPYVPNEQPVTKVAKNTPSASPSTSTPGSDNPFSMTNCISELKKMNGLPKSIQIKAISALTVEVWREAFMNMDGELREAWLESLEPDFKLLKPSPTFHGEGDSVQPVTDRNINETEIYPSQGKAPDVLNEIVLSSGEQENVKIVQPEKEDLPSKARTKGQGHKKSGYEVKQESAAQLNPNRTKPSKTTDLPTRSSERLARIKAQLNPDRHGPERQQSV